MEPLPLNDEAREVMRSARGRARGDRADRHHILVAALDAPGARRLLDMFGAEREKAVSAIEFVAGGDAPFPVERGAEEETVARAMAEAHRLGQSEVGSEHLIVALTHRPDTLGGGVLASLGITRDPAREVVRFLHGLVPDWEPPVDGSGSGTNDSHRVSFPLEMVDAADVPRPTDEEIAWIEARMRAAEDGPGRLVKVVAIGQTASSGGLTVELIALEVRETFAVVGWRARPDRPWLLGSPAARAHDESGTTYQAMSTGSSGGEHGSAGEVTILPAPPSTARVLTIEVLAFGDERFPMPRFGDIQTGPVTGPWRFEVSLDG